MWDEVVRESEFRSEVMADHAACVAMLVCLREDFTVADVANFCMAAVAGLSVIGYLDHVVAGDAHELPHRGRHKSFWHVRLRMVAVQVTFRLWLSQLGEDPAEWAAVNEAVDHTLSVYLENVLDPILWTSDFDQLLQRYSRDATVRAIAESSIGKISRIRSFMGFADGGGQPQLSSYFGSITLYASPPETS
jgi:hypothetical protein